MSLVDAIVDSVSKEIVMLREDGLPSDVKKFISTGSTLLDYAIANQDNGGIPVGKITEISGLEGTGKTLFGMQICANAQKEGALIIYIDAERALNSDFAMRVGLDVNSKDFIYMPLRTVEEVFSTMFTVFHKIDESEKRGEFKYPYVVIIWDSIAATPCQEDLNAENPDPASNVGLKPRILSKNMALLLDQTGRKNVAQVFLNQLRTNIRAQAFSDPYITPGGKAIPYYSSARIRLTQKGKIKAKEEIVGILTKGRVTKTRFGPPHRECEFGIYFTKGVDDSESIIDYLANKKAIKTKAGGQKGKQYSLDGVNYMSKVEFRKTMNKDADFRKLILAEASNLLKKDLVDPDEEEQTIEEGGED